MSEKLIRINNLPDNFRIKLKDDFKSYLFKKVLERVTMNKLCKMLNRSRKTIEEWRRGYHSRNNKRVQRFVRTYVLKTLSRISKIELNEIEKNIEGINAVDLTLKIKLPIKVSKELASLIGHSFGDGHVSVNYVSYTNKSKELIVEVKNNFAEVFGIVGKVIPKEDGTYMLYYPGIIGRLLSLMGSPLGDKTNTITKVPKWIKEGRKEIKSAFIRALFDDDGSVSFRKYHRVVNIRLFKNKIFLRQHLKFVKDIQLLLKDFGIVITRIIKVETKRNDTIGLGIEITAANNLINFLNLIGFTHPDKYRKLTEAVVSYRELQRPKKNFAQLYNKNEKWIMPSIKVIK